MCLENIYASIVRAKCDMHAHHEGVLKSNSLVAILELKAKNQKHFWTKTSAI